MTTGRKEPAHGTTQSPGHPRRSYKDRKAVAAALKEIYRAKDADAGAAALEAFAARLSGIPCAGHDDGKEGTRAWHDAKPRSSPTSCSTSCLRAVIRSPLSAGTVCSTS